MFSLFSKTLCLNSCKDENNSYLPNQRAERTPGTFCRAQFHSKHRRSPPWTWSLSESRRKSNTTDGEHSRSPKDRLNSLTKCQINQLITVKLIWDRNAIRILRKLTYNYFIYYYYYFYRFFFNSLLYSINSIQIGWEFRAIWSNSHPNLKEVQGALRVTTYQMNDSCCRQPNGYKNWYQLRQTDGAGCLQHIQILQYIRHCHKT